MRRTIRSVGVALATMGAGCGGSAPRVHEGGFWVPDEGRIVDLSRTTDGAATTIVAPAAVAQIEPGRLVAPLVVIDVSQRARNAPEFTFTIDDLAEFEGREGAIPAGAFVALRTGGGAPARDAGATGARVHPGFAAAVVEVLARQRGAVGFGSDAPALDPSSAGPQARDAALRAGRYVVTRLAGLGPFAGGRALVFLGAPLDARSEAPLRVLALAPRSASAASK